MKMKSIVRVSLVLGVLVTSVNTIMEQPVHVENKHVQVSQNSKNLKAYHTQPSAEYKNVTGHISSVQPKPGTKFLNMTEDSIVNNLALVGKGREHYYTGVYRNLDMFYVNEDKRSEGTKYSIGGITKASDKVISQVAEARAIKEDHTGEYGYDFFPFKIDEEAVTLKEVNFKIRRHLIDHYGLYGEMSSGTVTVQMRYYGGYTVELGKKLQEDRMADIVKVIDIDRIEVKVKKAQYLDWSS